jgi:hypothetical protein
LRVKPILILALQRLILVAATYFCLAGSINAAETVTPVEDRRNAEQTFLTYPEWFLVHSPKEMAAFFKQNLPGNFPYFAHIGQFWSSYEAVYDRTKDEFPFNSEYHTILVVIGTSTAVEYGIKGAYEYTLGRLSERTAGSEFTEEDRLGAAVAQEYVDFIVERPWYEFDFFSGFQRLWTDTSFFGDNMLRKLERKYVLSSEYLVKSLYARLIGFGSAASFDAPVHKTAVVASWPESGSQKSELIYLPRYQPFTDAAIELSRQNVVFEEIAGNNGRIVISLLGKEGWDAELANSTLLLQQPIITRPGLYRHIVEVDIRQLSLALQKSQLDGLTVEHIYDF